MTYQRHILHAPMLVHAATSTGRRGLLPEGTCLRYVESFPEGFDRYQVHVNVERHPLDREPAERPDLIDPLTAFGPGPLDHATLRALLRDLNVSKSDLQAVLNSYDDP